MVGYEPELNKTLLEYLSGVERNNLAPRTPQVGIPLATRPPIRMATPPPICVDEGYRGCLATPLVQVFCVRISTDFDDGIPCEIYGSIRASDGPQQPFVLYDRDPEDSETIANKGMLSLIGPNNGVILPSMNTTLDFCLKDKIHGVEIINKRLDLDLVSGDTYDNLLKVTVTGPHGFADLYFVVFKLAIYATLQITITKNDNNADIYGSIVARYEDDRMYLTDVDNEELTCLETRLFDRPSHEPLHVLVETPIKLSRNVVVVPAYSAFTVECNLWDSGCKIVDGCLNFAYRRWEDPPLFIQTEYARVGVQVRWHNAHSASLRNIRPTRGPSYTGGWSKPEVYSVVVGGITRNISALCGTIIIDDGYYKFSIYKRDESDKELLGDHSLACIEFNHRAIQGDDFGIILNLRDPVHNLEVSNGYLGWSIGTLSGWYDKQLCSVVRGKDGYAAVHHEIFFEAFEAVVEVKLFSDGDREIPMHLFGNLFVRYSGRDYSTSYQRKYYRSQIFDCLRERAVDVKWGSKIALLKSLVNVPARSSLIIEANLGAFGINSFDEPISGMTEFKICMDGPMMETIRGEHYWVEVSVKFS